MKTIDPEFPLSSRRKLMKINDGTSGEKFRNKRKLLMRVADADHSCPSNFYCPINHA